MARVKQGTWRWMALDAASLLTTLTNRLMADPTFTEHLGEGGHPDDFMKFCADFAVITIEGKERRENGHDMEYYPPFVTEMESVSVSSWDDNSDSTVPPL